MNALPSFLTRLTDVPDEIEFPTKTTKSDVYLGSIFFGVCKAHHPPLHSLQLARFNLVQHTASSQENVFNNLLLRKLDKKLSNLSLSGQKKRPQKNSCFLAKIVPVKKKVDSPKFHVRIPRKKKLFDDPFPHKCPGTKKVFKQEIHPRLIDLGETTSKLTGETSQEIRFCRLKSISSDNSLNDVEMVTLSDIREKNMTYMTREERAAHGHFPKEFVTVQVVGPKIPASIMITAIPSKRRKPSDYKYKVISKIEKKKKEEEEKEENEKKFKAGSYQTIAKEASDKMEILESLPHNANDDILILTEESRESIAQILDEGFSVKSLESNEGDKSYEVEEESEKKVLSSTDSIEEEQVKQSEDVNFPEVTENEGEGQD